MWALLRLPRFGGAVREPVVAYICVDLVALGDVVVGHFLAGYGVELGVLDAVSGVLY
jgi:hypothetical protein